MQDRRTGEMLKISEKEADRLEVVNRTFKGKKTPVFRQGEVVEVKEGRFRILRLTPLGMVLKGVPDTTPLGHSKNR